MTFNSMWKQIERTNKQIDRIGGQSNVINMMDEFVKDPANKYNLVPVLLTLRKGRKEVR